MRYTFDKSHPNYTLFTERPPNSNLAVFLRYLDRVKPDKNWEFGTITHEDIENFMNSPGKGGIPLSNKKKGTYAAGIREYVRIHLSETPAALLVENDPTLIKCIKNKYIEDASERPDSERSDSERSDSERSDSERSDSEIDLEPGLQALSAGEVRAKVYINDSKKQKKEHKFVLESEFKSSKDEIIIDTKILGKFVTINHGYKTTDEKGDFIYTIQTRDLGFKFDRPRYLQHQQKAYEQRQGGMSMQPFSSAGLDPESKESLFPAEDPNNPPKRRHQKTVQAIEIDRLEPEQAQVLATLKKTHERTDSVPAKDIASASSEEDIERSEHVGKIYRSYNKTNRHYRYEFIPDVAFDGINDPIETETLKKAYGPLSMHATIIEEEDKYRKDFLCAVRRGSEIKIDLDKHRSQQSKAAGDFMSFAPKGMSTPSVSTASRRSHKRKAPPKATDEFGESQTRRRSARLSAAPSRQSDSSSALVGSFEIAAKSGPSSIAGASGLEDVRGTGLSDGVRDLKTNERFEPDSHIRSVMQYAIKGGQAAASGKFFDSGEAALLYSTVNLHPKDVQRFLDTTKPADDEVDAYTYVRLTLEEVSSSFSFGDFEQKMHERIAAKFESERDIVKNAIRWENLPLPRVISPDSPPAFYEEPGDPDFMRGLTGFGSESRGTESLMSSPRVPDERSGDVTMSGFQSEASPTVPLSPSRSQTSARSELEFEDASMADLGEREIVGISTPKLRDEDLRLRRSVSGSPEEQRYNSSQQALEYDADLAAPETGSQLPFPEQAQPKALPNPFADLSSVMIDETEDLHREQRSGFDTLYAGSNLEMNPEEIVHVASSRCQTPSPIESQPLSPEEPIQHVERPALPGASSPEMPQSPPLIPPLTTLQSLKPPAPRSRSLTPPSNALRISTSRSGGASPQSPGQWERGR